MNPLARMLASSKALVMLGTMLGAFVLVGLGKISFDRAVAFLTVTVPAWMLAVGFEDAAKKNADGKIAAAKVSMRPPPMTGAEEHDDLA